MNKTIELRTNKLTLASHGEGLIVSGYVNKTGQLSELLGTVKRFRERIAPGAFKKAIENKTRDIDFLAEHDNKAVLASTRNNSLTLSEDQEGLLMEARITPTSWGKDYYQLIADGLIQSMSFGFRNLKDSWAQINGEVIRTVEELELVEVSAVKDPAYSQSSIAARGFNLVEEVEVPENISEHSDNKNDERGNEDMKMKMENRTTDFAVILRGEERSLTTTADGGSVIPEQVHNEIIVKMEETSKVFAKARKLNSVAGTLRVARENDAVQAGFVGEGENIIEGALGFEHVDLKQKRVGAAVTLSKQLINDAAVNIEEYTKNLLARRTAKAVEKSMLVGQGGVEFNGIIHDADIQVVPAGDVVGLDDLQALYLAVHPEFLTGASYVMSRGFFNTTARLKDGNGHYYIQNGIVNGKLTYTLFGAEIDVTDALPADTPVVFGNITEAVSVMIKTESGIQEIVDTQQSLRGSKLFVYDAYMDAAVVNPQAIAKLVVSND